MVLSVLSYLVYWCESFILTKTNRQHENQTYHFALANLYYSEKHYKKALEELVGDFFEARFLKSVILYETGYLALARKELRDLQTEYPEREMVAEYLNRINSELGLN